MIALQATGLYAALSTIIFLHSTYMWYTSSEERASAESVDAWHQELHVNGSARDLWCVSSVNPLLRVDSISFNTSRIRSVRRSHQQRCCEWILSLELVNLRPWQSALTRIILLVRGPTGGAEDRSIAVMIRHLKAAQFRRMSHVEKEDKKCMFSIMEDFQN